MKTIDGGQGLGVPGKRAERLRDQDGEGSVPGHVIFASSGSPPPIPSASTECSTLGRRVRRFPRART